MSDHGTIQTILGHDAASAPCLAGLPLLGSPVLEPNLKQIDNEETIMAVHIAHIGK